MRTRHVQLLVLAGAVLALVAGCSTAQSQSVQPTGASRSMPAMQVGSSSATLSRGASVGEKIWTLAQTPSGKLSFTGGSPDVGNGACANCHGDKVQGGDGPMIGWSMLSATATSMENMPKYTYTSADQVYAAVTTGVRPDGTALNANMPRYSLSRADFEQLFAFLKTK